MFIGYFGYGQNQPIYELLENGTLSSITEEINENNEKSSIIDQAYLGSLYCRRAAFQKSPQHKKEDFIKGAKLLESSISQDPKNLEIRFLRYIIQTQSPKFLGYNENISEDKALLESNADNISKKLKNIIQDFNSSNSSLTIDV